MQPMMSTQQQPMANRVQLSDSDLANVVLSELKRVAREYTTAALEASDPQIRQLFERALQQTLQDQEKLYKVMGALNLYGQPVKASRQDLQSELQSNAQTSQKLRSWMEQSLQSAGASQPQGPNRSLGNQGSSTYAPSYQPSSSFNPNKTSYAPTPNNQGMTQRQGASYGQMGTSGYGGMNSQQQGYGQGQMNQGGQQSRGYSGANYGTGTSGTNRQPSTDYGMSWEHASNQGASHVAPPLASMPGYQAGVAMGVNPVYRQEQTAQSNAMQEQRVQTAKGTAAQPYNTIQHNPNHPQNKNAFAYGAGGDMSPSGYGTSNSTEPRIQMDEEGIADEHAVQAKASAGEKKSTSRKKQDASMDVSPSAAMYQTASQGQTEYNTSGTSQTKRHVTGSGEAENQTN